MSEKDKIIAELKEFDMTDEQFEAALNRRLAQLQPCRVVDDSDDGYCSACVL